MGKAQGIPSMDTFQTRAVGTVKLGGKSPRFGNTGCGVFKRGDTKLERFLPKNQLTLGKLLNFEFWINGELSKSAKI